MMKEDHCSWMLAAVLICLWMSRKVSERPRWCHASNANQAGWQVSVYVPSKVCEFFVDAFQSHFVCVNVGLKECKGCSVGVWRCSLDLVLELQSEEWLRGERRQKGVTKKRDGVDLEGSGSGLRRITFSLRKQLKRVLQGSGSNFLENLDSLYYRKTWGKGNTWKLEELLPTFYCSGESPKFRWHAAWRLGCSFLHLFSTDTTHFLLR